MSMPYSHEINCRNGRHAYVAGYCEYCFKLNEKLSDYEKFECTKLRDKLAEKARKERAKA